MPTKRKKRVVYTDEFRAQAVAALQAAGYPGTEGALSRTARQFNIPNNTLYQWAVGLRNPPPSQLREEKKADLATLIETELFEILKLIPNKRERANFSQLTVGFGVFFDKLRLLKGLPTELIQVLPDFISAAQAIDVSPAAAINAMIAQMHARATPE